MAKIKSEIINALITLGVPANVNIIAIMIDYNRIIIKIDEEYFGLWDITKANFVD